MNHRHRGRDATGQVSPWHLPLLILLFTVSAAGCAGTPDTGSPLSMSTGTVTYQPAAPRAVRPLCRVARTGASVRGRPVIEVRCGALDLTPASHTSPRPGAVFLRDLVRAGQDVAAIEDQAIRATEEYRAYMEPRNRWQWHDRATGAEALAACRAMLADLAAGRRVRWDTQARAYLMHARQRLGAAGVPTGPTGSGASGRLRTGPGASDTMPPRPIHPGPGQTVVRQPDRPGPPGQPAQPGRPGQDRGPSASPPGSDPDPAADIYVPFDDLFDDDHRLVRELRRAGREREASRLERLLEYADDCAGAAGVLLSGTFITIGMTSVLVYGDSMAVTLVAPGTLPADLDLAGRMATPALEELSHTLTEIERTRHALDLPGSIQLVPDHPHVAEARTEYHALMRRPAEAMTRPELERLHDVSAVAGVVDPLTPGSPSHKAQRWHDYQGRHGTWQFERWSTTYEQNMTRASKAHQAADEYHKTLGWGKREVPVDIMDGAEKRVLDIGDLNGKRGVEVKTGYVSLTADVAYQIKRDAWLVAKENWSIHWRVEGRMSKPLRAALEAADIEFTETQPDTLIKDL